MKNSQYSTYVKLFRLFTVLAIAGVPFTLFYSKVIFFVAGLACCCAASFFKILYQHMEIKVLKEEVEKLKNV